MNGYWGKFSPEAFKDFWEFHIYQEAIKKILMLVREVSEVSPGMDDADMQEVILVPCFWFNSMSFGHLDKFQSEHRNSSSKQENRLILFYVGY